MEGVGGGEWGVAGLKKEIVFLQTHHTNLTTQSIFVLGNNTLDFTDEDARTT